MKYDVIPTRSEAVASSAFPFAVVIRAVLVAKKGGERSARSGPGQFAQEPHRPIGTNSRVPCPIAKGSQSSSVPAKIERKMRHMT